MEQIYRDDESRTKECHGAWTSSVRLQCYLTDAYGFRQNDDALFLFEPPKHTEQKDYYGGGSRGV